VAIEVFIVLSFGLAESNCFAERSLTRPVAGSKRTVKPRKIGRDPGEEPESFDRLVHAHPVTAEDARLAEL